MLVNRSIRPQKFLAMLWGLGIRFIKNSDPLKIDYKLLIDYKSPFYEETYSRIQIIVDRRDLQLI